MELVVCLEFANCFGLEESFGNSVPANSAKHLRALGQVLEIRRLQGSLDLFTDALRLRVALLTEKKEKENPHA